MSPLRRFWLAWLSFWPIPFAIAVQALVLAVLVLAALRQGRDPASLMQVHPALGFLLVPVLIGMHLKQLANGSTLSMDGRHAVWQQRVVLLALLPANALIVTSGLILMGVAPLPAAVSGIVPTLLGAWMGCAARLLPYLCAWALWGSAYGAALLGANERMLHALELVAAGIGFAVAWFRMGSGLPLSRSGAPSGRRWWEEALVPRTEFRARSSLPGVAVAIRAGIGGTAFHRLRLVAAAAGIAGTASLLVRSGDDLVSLLIIACMFPAYASAFRHLAFRRTDGKTDWFHFRAALACERLLPFPRRRSAVVSLLSPVVSSLGVTGPLALGATLGLWIPHAVVPEAAAWSARAWLILPAATVFSLGIVATFILFQVLRRWLLVVFWLSLAGIFLGWAALAAGQTLSDWQMMGVAAGMAVLLTLVAWQRLAEADLP